jgi:hypothetical protein
VLDARRSLCHTPTMSEDTAKSADMVRRHPANDSNLLKAQYGRLRDALDGYYIGKREQVLNIAATIRVLVHDKPSTSSRSLLSRLNADYWDLFIYDKLPPHPNAVLTIRTSIVFAVGGPTRTARPEFLETLYHLVPLREWWTGDYQLIGSKRLSKETIVRTVADKDGGTHVDAKVPQVYATLSEPPVRYGTETEGQLSFIQPNMAYDVTAQAGCELQDYLERHFPYLK